MRTLNIIAATCILLAGVACGDNASAPTKSTYPPPNPAVRLWGTWDYVGAELADWVVPHVQEYFKNKGIVSPDRIDEAVAEYTADLVDGFIASMVFYRSNWAVDEGAVAFVKDNEVYFGGGAGYFVEGDLIVIYGHPRAVWWSITGDVLTITFKVYEFRELFQTDEDRAPIDAVYSKNYYEYEKGFTVILKRRI